MYVGENPYTSDGRTKIQRIADAFHETIGYYAISTFSYISERFWGWFGYQKLEHYTHVDEMLPQHNPRGQIIG